MKDQDLGDHGTGQLIGHRYALVSQIRDEPWGRVWLARDQVLETHVGLKLLEQEDPAWTEGWPILEQEAVQALRLRHPRILGIYYLGKTGEAAYLVQEPFAGESLLAKLNRLQHFNLPQSLDLLEQVSEALAWAHELSIAHRSVSPLHILLQGEEVRLGNFTFPPATGDEVAHLELKAYVAPEIIEGEAPTAAANVFSLGVLGFRLVAGSLPYPLTFDEPFPYRLDSLPVDLDEIPLPLQNLLLQCLAVEPEERLPDAGTFLSYLLQVREEISPERPGVYRRWQQEGPERLRQAAAQAGALLERLREAGKPLRQKVSQKMGEGTRTFWATLRGAPFRLWAGLGLAALIVALFVFGGLKTKQPVATQPQPANAKAAPPQPANAKVTPPQPATAAPLPLPAGGGGPPLVETGEAAAPRPGLAVKSVAGPPASVAGSSTPEAKAAPQERYLVAVATYTSRKPAQALLAKLKARNYHPKIISQKFKGKTLYQVQVGPFTGVKAAEAAARNIKEQERIDAKIVKITRKPATKKPVKKTATTLSRRPTR